jgi:N-acetyl-anhydromuramyl-L-alanine amidase AmpD
MTKSFFIVVPYSQTSLKPESDLFDKFFGKKDKKKLKLEAELDFEEKRSQLEQRVSVIQQGLSRCGIKSAQLGTEEVIEVFYKVFNPGELEGKIELEKQS